MAFLSAEIDSFLIFLPILGFTIIVLLHDKRRVLTPNSLLDHFSSLGF